MQIMLLVHLSYPLFWKQVYEYTNGRRKCGGAQLCV